MSASIVTVACLQNPRIPTNLSDGYVMLDMTFYLRHDTQSPDSDSPVLKTALVRYFNAEGLVFNAEEDMYALVICSVSSTVVIVI